MAIDSINSTLNALQSVAAQANGQSLIQQGKSASAAGFMGELHSSLRRVNEIQQAGKAKMQAFQLGVPGIELNDVMVDIQKASISMQMTTQVRNKLVHAYKEVMNMPV